MVAGVMKTDSSKVERNWRSQTPNTAFFIYINNVNIFRNDPKLVVLLVTSL